VSTSPMSPEDDGDLRPGVLYPGGGWISGAASAPSPHNDRRPAFNPAFLVHEVERILREHRIDLDRDSSRRRVAELAAGDLLRALGVNPDAAPWRAQ
jgi:hypothetical protein